ncbi:putative serine/threonine-protein kinase, partial [Quercus suber]
EPRLTHQGMGGAQAKPSNNSSHPRGLDKLKLQNGYVGKGGNMHREYGRKYNSGNVSRKEVPFMPIETVELVDGLPKWLTDNVPRKVLSTLVVKSADSYDKLFKVGQGTYSNVYKARDRDTNEIVALKKVRFDISQPDSVKFMAREMIFLHKLDHPNIIKLQGLATSRMHYSLYLVFDFMETDLATIIFRREERLTESQVKCYMHQLLSGLKYCHDSGIIHRYIKAANILIDKNGVLKIADFGLANNYRTNNPLTNRVVTLWYRAPELLLGAIYYKDGIDLWSAGCLLAEMLAGTAIMPGKTEVEQIDMIFRLCGTPSEEYWEKLELHKKFELPKYKRSLENAFRKFPESSLGLLRTLLALDPAHRGSASSALQDKFFYTSPLACALSELPVVYSKNEEVVEAKEERSYRKSRMKQRSRTHCERRGKDLDTEMPKEDSDFSTKKAEKSAEATVEKQEPGRIFSSSSSVEKPNSRAESPPLSTSSTSSSVKPSSQTESSSFLFSPDFTYTNQRMSLRTPDHPNAKKNIKNMIPIPISRTRSTANDDNDKNDMYKLKSVHRSASTREFRRTTSRFEVYAVDV